MALVFQYGSNMSTERLNAPDRLNGAAKVIGLARTEADFELIFDLWSERNNCAAADLIPGAGRDILGVLYEIPDYLIDRKTAGKEKSLDAIEGEGKNYERVEIKLRKGDDSATGVLAITYVGLEAARKPSIQTSATYVRHILKGLREHNFSADYVNYVKAQVLSNAPALAGDLVDFES